MSTTNASRPPGLAARIALVVTVGALAALLLSSSLMSAIICGVTVAAVMLDLVLHARGELHEPAPDKITVDLSRRS